MLRAITAATSTASAAPIPVRGAQAVAASATAGTYAGTVAPVEAVPAQVSLAPPPQVFRFNSTEFIYRQDIGRIILIGQSPVTGERKIQIPSEEALRAYERTIRAEEQRTLVASEAKIGSTEPKRTEAPFVATPKSPVSPKLSEALSAVVGGGESSGLVSVSA